MKILQVLSLLVLTQFCIAQNIPEVTLCDTEREITLSIKNYNSNYNYTWISYDNLFPTTSDPYVKFIVDTPGIYSATLITRSFNPACNDAKSTITFKVKFCNDWAFYVPNAVYPNGVYNKTWYPKMWNVVMVELIISNRWGEIIHDKLEPWDPAGVYAGVYIARIVYVRPPGYKVVGYFKIIVVD